MSGVMIITGASRGIGAATARLAASEGFDVCVNYRSRSDEAEAVVEACRAQGAKAMAVAGDVGVEAEVEALFAASQDALGPVTVVVNNAGIIHPQARLEAFTLDRMEEVVRVNLIGALLVARAAVRRMSTAHGGDGGVIVNVSSAASYLGSPNEYIDYAATKGAMDTMTVGLAKEVAGEGIRVNAVRPGLIYTDIHGDGGEPGRVDRLAPNVPMARGGDAAEVAEAIVWLASPQSSYVTGALLNVSGGR